MCGYKLGCSFYLNKCGTFRRQRVDYKYEDLGNIAVAIRVYTGLFPIHAGMNQSLGEILRYYFYHTRLNVPGI